MIHLLGTLTWRTLFTLPNGSCGNGQDGCRVSTNPLNRTDQRRPFDEVTPVADIDQSKAIIAVSADMNLCAGWEVFVRSGRLQCFPKKHRIVPNLAGSTLFASNWGDSLSPAAANKASDLGHG